VFAKFRDTSDKSVRSSLIKEYGVISFFFDFSLCPFLSVSRFTLAPAFFCEAALAMASLLFFCPCTGCFPIVYINIILI